MTPFGIGRDQNDDEEQQPGAPAPPPDEGVSNVGPVGGAHSDGHVAAIEAQPGLVVLRSQVASAQTQLQPSVRQQIDRCSLTRHQDRMA